MIKELKPQDKIDFGKHSGYRLEEIYRFSPSYLEWAIEYVDNFILDINEFENLPQPTPFSKSYPETNNENITLYYFHDGESEIPHAYTAQKNGEILNEIDYHFPERIKEINNKKIKQDYITPAWIPLSDRPKISIKDLKVEEYNPFNIKKK